MNSLEPMLFSVDGHAGNNGCRALITKSIKCPAHLGEPAKEVVHDYGGDEGLAKAGGQADECVVQQCALHNGHLVCPLRHACWVDPGLCGIPVKYMRLVICQL